MQICLQVDYIRDFLENPISLLVGPPPPLDKHYHQLELRTTAGYWKIFNARSVFGDKVRARVHRVLGISRGLRLGLRY